MRQTRQRATESVVETVGDPSPSPPFEGVDVSPPVPPLQRKGVS
jgi:hypothetical protein